MDVRLMLEQSVERWAYIGHPALHERFVLRNGKVFAGKELPKPFTRGIPNQCYLNATNAATSDPRLVYYEGFGISEALPIPLSHAWCVLDGEVIDFTWRKPQDCLYIGVRIDTDTLIEQVVENEVYGILDLGHGVNYKFMFSVDPDLEEIVRNVKRTAPAGLL